MCGCHHHHIIGNSEKSTAIPQRNTIEIHGKSNVKTFTKSMHLIVVSGNACTACDYPHCFTATGCTASADSSMNLHMLKKRNMDIVSCNFEFVVLKPKTSHACKQSRTCWIVSMRSESCMASRCSYLTPVQVRHFLDFSTVRSERDFAMHEHTDTMMPCTVHWTKRNVTHRYNRDWPRNRCARKADCAGYLLKSITHLKANNWKHISRLCSTQE